MDISFFESSAAFRDWLEANHESASELLVGFHKKATGRPSLTWPESVDQSLCFGWIDGIRKSIDAEAYTIRFTPRKAGSTWSNVNIKRVARSRAVAATRLGPVSAPASTKTICGHSRRTRRHGRTSSRRHRRTGDWWDSGLRTRSGRRRAAGGCPPSSKCRETRAGLISCLPGEPRDRDTRRTTLIRAESAG